MPDLTELQRLAEGALAHGEMIGESSWYAAGTIAGLANRGANGMTAVSEPDDAFIAAMNPDTAKKLIAVALLADALVNPPQMATGYHQRKQREADESALRTALRELAGSPQERREG